MAEVWKARVSGPAGFEKVVAVKRLLQELVHDPSQVRSFTEEAKLVALLQHPNIVQVIDFGATDDEGYYIAMDFVDGPNLSAVLRMLDEQHVRLSSNFSLYVIHEVAQALEYAHAASDRNGEPMHIVHRDISPQNILVSRRGEIKVTDFGIAKFAANQTQTVAGVIKGKAAYLSPEQVRFEPLDRRSDLFSLCIVLYEMITGRRLFYTPSMAQSALLIDSFDPSSSPEIAAAPERIQPILLKGLQPQPEDRFQSAGELISAITQIVSAEHLSIAGSTLGGLVSSFFEESESGEPEDTLKQAPSDPTPIVKIEPVQASLVSVNLAATSMEPVDHSSMRVIVADQKASRAQAAAALIKADGHRSKVATSAEELIGLLKAQPYDVILTRSDFSKSLGDLKRRITSVFPMLEFRVVESMSEAWWGGEVLRAERDSLQSLIALARQLAPDAADAADVAVELAERVALKVGLPPGRAHDTALAAFVAAMAPAIVENADDKSLREIRLEATALLQTAARGPVLDSVLSCIEERPDGTGPNGLRGDEIPLESRILAVVLEYAHSRTAVRLSFNQTSGVFRAFSASRFDTRVIESFLAVLREGDADEGVPARNVLLALHDPELASTVSLRLETEGHAVSRATDGREALRLATDSHPDIIIASVALPGVDGLNLAFDIRDTDWGTSLPMVLLSERQDDSIRERADAAGVNACFSLPVDLEDLIAGLQPYLSSQKA